MILEVYSFSGPFVLFRDRKWHVHRGSTVYTIAFQTYLSKPCRRRRLSGWRGPEHTTPCYLRLCWCTSCYRCASPHTHTRNQMFIWIIESVCRQGLFLFVSCLAHNSTSLFHPLGSLLFSLCLCRGSLVKGVIISNSPKHSEALSWCLAVFGALGGVHWLQSQSIKILTIQLFHQLSTKIMNVLNEQQVCAFLEALSFSTLGECSLQ